MARKRSNSRRRMMAGKSPGALIANPGAGQSTIRLIAYGPDSFSEHPSCDVEKAIAARGTAPIVWIDVTGLGDTDLIARLGEAFGLHELALEDVLNTDQRPKVETYRDHLFIALRMIDTGNEPATEQMSIFVGKGFVLTFQERPGDCLGPVRERLKHGRGRLRAVGADYLAYALVDAVIDGFFPVLETIGEEIDTLEDAVVAAPRREHIARLHRLKRDLLTVRRAVWPTRELVNSIIRDENPLISHDTQLFARDAYDHTIQLLDLVETYRDIASALVDLYLSSQSARMNEIMKLLTIIATIFIPLSFLASLWGMNFNTAEPLNMPELNWAFGYPAALSIMAVVAVVLLGYFWRRGWLDGEIGSGANDEEKRRGE